MAVAVAALGAGCGDDDDDDDAPAVDASTRLDAPAVPIDAAPADAAGPDASGIDAAAGTPDLTLLGARTATSLLFMTQSFNESSCAFLEECIGGVGPRRLLRFDVATYNAGDGDLVVGVPDPRDPMWEFSTCPSHDHYHFAGYASYDLVGAGGIVASGHKQAFCLMDTNHIDPSQPGSGYTCAFQGISAGWADTYGRALDCQWIDITDVVPGEYTLRIEINPEQRLVESDYTNNVFETPVTIE
jgi:hypothetical protein